jgi:uncharacterized repeat protein (TIGR04138 family)
MQNTGFQEAVETVCQEDRRYHPEAYAFLRDSLEATIKRRKKSKKEPGPHVGAAELLDGFRLHALAEFGPMALMVLNYWGVKATADVGQMVSISFKPASSGRPMKIRRRASWTSSISVKPLLLPSVH